MNKLFTCRFFPLLVAGLLLSGITNAQTRRKTTTNKTTTRKTTIQKSKPTELVGKVGTPVDLGLSVKWASWGVGASSTTEIGAGYYWAETVQCYPDKRSRHYYPYYDNNERHATKYYYYKKMTVCIPTKINILLPMALESLAKGILE